MSDTTLTAAERTALLCDCAEYEHPFTPGHDNACGVTSNLWLEIPPSEVQARVERILAQRAAADPTVEAIRALADEWGQWAKDDHAHVQTSPVPRETRREAYCWGEASDALRAALGDQP